MKHYWLEKLVSRFPQLYWQIKADSFLTDPWQKRLFPEHRWLVQTIHTLKPVSILEAGCGFGRNLRWLVSQGINPAQLTGIDISSVLLAQARLPNSVRLIRGNVLRLPFSSDSFDLVFTHGLLMHLSPCQLPQALSELTRVSQKHLILIEEVRSRPRQLNYFTWAHDYDKMIAALPIQVVSKKPGQHSLIWYLLKK
jgi:ubiquinone/menaquinone biosynthesis C-methylase UbiE